jgi:hypothetical protein
VSIIKQQLPFWRAIDIRWSRYDVDETSPEYALIRWPSSRNKDLEWGPKAPRDSIAIGEKK